MGIIEGFQGVVLGVGRLFAGVVGAQFAHQLGLAGALVDIAGGAGVERVEAVAKARRQRTKVAPVRVVALVVRACLHARMLA